MSEVSWLIEIIRGAVSSLVMLILIAIPLMVVIEFAKEFRLIDKLGPFLSPVLKAFRLPEHAVFPLLAGIFFGLVYGAGVIIQSAKEGLLTKENMFVVCLFLVIFHSIIEDTMLFVAVGANFWFIVLVRLMLAVMLAFFWTHVYHRIQNRAKRKTEKTFL